MISYLKKLYEDWQAAGADGPDPSLLEMEKMTTSAVRRVNKEERKAARWARSPMGRKNVFQLVRLHRRAVRFDCPEVAGNIEVILESRQRGGERHKARLALEKAIRTAAGRPLAPVHPQGR